MTEVELIAYQAKRVVELERTVQDLSFRMAEVHLNIICGGGPLNDNKLHYSPAQLVLFSKIDDLVYPI